MLRMMRSLCGMVLAATPGMAWAAGDNCGLVTPSNYELQCDERLLATYGAFNGLGLDRGDTPQTRPFPRVQFHPVRTKVRQALQAPAAVSALAPVAQFVEAHPAPLETYVEAALRLTPQPEGAWTSEAPLPPGVDGLGGVLAEWWRKAKIGKLHADLQSDQRAAFKSLRESVDAPFSKLRKAARIADDADDAPALVLYPNALDAPSEAVALDLEGVHTVVFGIASPGAAAPDLGAALRAYARLLSQQAVTAAGDATTSVEPLIDAGRKAGSIAGGSDARTVVVDAVAWTLLRTVDPALAGAAPHGGVLSALADAADLTGRDWLAQGLRRLTDKRSSDPRPSSRRGGRGSR